MIKNMLKGFTGVVLTSVIVFYLLVGAGISPKLQTLWVTTSMTTMNHKWLATTIVSKLRIEEIMAENYVDDTSYESDIININNNNNSNNLDGAEHTNKKYNSKHDNYLSEGYKELETGVYLKDIAGKGWKGKIMLIGDPTRVKLADTPKQFEKGSTVKRMVQFKGAVAGVNGGGF